MGCSKNLVDSELLMRKFEAIGYHCVHDSHRPEGEDCFIDEHLGFIKFGSRVDLYLPLGTEINVKLGQTTTGNQTIIGKLKVNA